MARIGRPPKPIDGEMVYKMASIGSSQQEIADYFDVSRATITNRFSQEFRLGKAVSKKCLRRWQFRRARQGSDALLIHLGKVYLGQDTKSDPEETPDEAIPRDADDKDIDP